MGHQILFMSFIIPWYICELHHNLKYLWATSYLDIFVSYIIPWHICELHHTRSYLWATSYLEIFVSYIIFISWHICELYHTLTYLWAYLLELKYSWQVVCWNLEQSARQYLQQSMDPGLWTTKLKKYWDSLEKWLKS